MSSRGLRWVEAELDSIMHVMKLQQARRRHRDAYLPCWSEAELRSRAGEVSACDDGQVHCLAFNERIVGIAYADIMLHEETDDLTYWPRRMGIARELIILEVPGVNVETTIRLLVDALQETWLSANATGAALMWPSRDLDICAGIARGGFAIDARFAIDESNVTIEKSAEFHDAIGTRRAVAEDEDAVVSLFLDVISAHIPCSPFAVRVPSAEDRFRERFSRALTTEQVSDTTPLILVAELDSKVLAMAECFLVKGGSKAEAKLRDGKYGYVNSFGVLQNLRHYGVGSILASAVNDELAALQVDGRCLWYSTYNRSARQFWPKMGYRPLWTSYQIRY